jgi:hypothetical protein
MRSSKSALAEDGRIGADTPACSPRIDGRSFGFEMLSIGISHTSATPDYMRLRVARLPTMRDMGRMWGTAANSMRAGASGPPRRLKVGVGSQTSVGGERALAVDDALLTADELGEELYLVRPVSRPGAAERESAPDQWDELTDKDESGARKSGSSDELNAAPVDSQPDLTAVSSHVGPAQPLAPPHADSVLPSIRSSATAQFDPRHSQATNAAVEDLDL